MRLLTRAVLLALLSTAVVTLHAEAWIRSPATTFATLPDGSTGPEGITADSAGNIYVTTFGFTASGPTAGPGQLFIFGHSGRLLHQVGISGSTSHLLGLAFHPKSGILLVIDFGAGNVLAVNPVTGASSVFATVTGSPGLNALAFDSAGNVYISDSFQGIIWKTGQAGGAATAWVTDTLLATSGVPPFGANGLAFNNSETVLFVANTGNDTVVQIPVTNGTPGTPAVFVRQPGG